MFPALVKLSTGKLALVLASSVLLAAVAATAAVTLVFSNNVTVTNQVAPPPIVFASGADSGLGTYVTAFSLSTNKTYFTSTIKGVPEMSLTVGDLFHLTNQDTATHTVTLTAGQVTSTYVTAYTIAFYDGGTLVGTLDLKNASPSLTLSNMVASKIYTAKITLTLASGAGNNNASATSSLSLTVA